MIAVLQPCFAKIRPIQLQANQPASSIPDSSERPFIPRECKLSEAHSLCPVSADSSALRCQSPRNALDYHSHLASSQLSQASKPTPPATPAVLPSTSRLANSGYSEYTGKGNGLERNLVTARLWIILQQPRTLAIVAGPGRKSAPMISNVVNIPAPAADGDAHTQRPDHRGNLDC